MNIVEFLEARIAEDEETAKAAWSDSPWVVHERWHDIRGGRSFNTFAVMDGQREVTIVYMGGTARHLAHWHPTRVLAECAAKRAIVDECLEVLIRVEDDVAEVERGIEVAVDCRDQGPGLAWATLRHLAAAYADHPDYDQVWRV